MQCHGCPYLLPRSRLERSILRTFSKLVASLSSVTFSSPGIDQVRVLARQFNVEQVGARFYENVVTIRMKATVLFPTTDLNPFTFDVVEILCIRWCFCKLNARNSIRKGKYKQNCERKHFQFPFKVCP
jgi:hypothetical protein